MKLHETNPVGLAAGQPSMSPVEGRLDSVELPDGELGAALFEGILRQLESAVDLDGWDQPAQLFVVSAPVAAHPLWDSLSADRPAGPARQLRRDADMAAVAVAPLGSLSGHPVDALWGFTAPDEAAALVLVSEGWAHTAEEDAGAAGLSAGRRETRVAQAVTRQGRCYVLHRMRGELPEFNALELGAPTGMVGDVLCRAIGAPVTPSPFRPVHVLGNEVLMLVTAMAAAVDPELDLSLVPESTRPFARDLRDLIFGLDSESQGDALAELFVLAAERAIATFAADVSSVAGGDLLGVLDGVGDSWRPSPATLDAIRVATAKLTWADFAETALSAVLPDELQLGPGWAGENLAGKLAQYWLGSHGPDIAAALAFRFGDSAISPVLALLNSVGWLAQEPLSTWGLAGSH